MKEWKDYTSDRLICEHPDGFYVIKPKEEQEFVPFFCNFCDKIMTSIYDEEAHKKFNCCDKCASKHVYPRLEDWKNGWRPSREDVTT